VRGTPSGTVRRLTQWLRTSYPVIGGSTADGHSLSVILLQYPTDIYVGDIVGPHAPLRNVRRLTRDNRDDDFPFWTPDGRSVLYSSDQNGDFAVYSQPLDASTAEPLAQGPGNQFAARMTPDGRWLLFLDDRRGAQLLRMPVGGGGRDSVPLPAGT